MPDIHVFDSRSASVGETLIGLKVQNWKKKDWILTAL